MTGLDYISAALRLCGVVAPGETVGGPEGADGLSALNRMLDGWSMELGAILSETQESFTLTSSDESYTIGATGDLTTTRPIRVIAAVIRDSSSNDYTLRVVTNHEYQEIVTKEPGDGVPRIMAYNPAYPNATITFFPPPDTGYTFRLTSLKPLAAVTLAGSYSVAPGYDDAIIYNLAYRLGMEYGAPNLAGIYEHATKLYSALKLGNMEVDELTLDPNLPTSFGRWDIQTGDYI